MPRLQVQPVPLRAIGTSVCGTLGRVSVTVTIPLVGPADALLLTVIVYSPVSPRSKSSSWVLVMVREAVFTVRFAVAVLPVPPLSELTGPVMLV